MSAEAFPLQWPEGWPRTPAAKRQRARFQVSSFARVRDGAVRELDLMGGLHTVLSTNIPLRLDGLPYAGSREPEDPGVAVYWFEPYEEETRCMACDRWDKVLHNLRAIELSLGAMRGLDRWGSSEIVHRAFRGFAALPPSGDDWRAVFGVPAGERPPLATVKEQYRRLAMCAHPDRGGNASEMQRLNQAMSAAEKELT